MKNKNGIPVANVARKSKKVKTVSTRTTDTIPKVGSGVPHPSKSQRVGTTVYSKVTKGRDYIISQGDIVLFPFSMIQHGNKTRPCVVMSVSSFNRSAEYVYIVPMYTNTLNGKENYATHIKLTHKHMSTVEKEKYQSREELQQNGSYLAVEQGIWVMKSTIHEHIGKVEEFHQQYLPTFKAIMSTLF